MTDHLDLAIVHTEEISLQPEGYRIFVSPKKGRFSRWIAGVAWRFLHWMGCLQPYHHRTIVYRYEKSERDRVTEMVLRQVDEVIRRGRDPERYCLVLGGAEFSEVISDYAGDRAAWITVPAGRSVHLLPGGYRAEFRGFPVHVVPHLSGVALLPKVLVEHPYDYLTRGPI